MTIQIKDNTIELKQTLRSMIIFEKITERTFNIINISDVVIYFYSVVMASSLNSNITFDEFVDWLDNNPESFTEFNEWLTTEAEKNNKLTGKKKKK